MPEERLKPEEIRYLALEGGGGKGFAYLGAIQVLEDIESVNVIARLAAVSGTSAGAITALMLALGMSAAEIEEELTGDAVDFNSFFDPPFDDQGRRMLPRPGAYIPQNPVPCEQIMLDGWRPALALGGAARGAAAFALPGAILGALAGAAGPMLRCLRERDTALAMILQSYAWLLAGPGDFTRKITMMLGLLADRLSPETKDLVARLLSSLPQYLVFLDRDMGLFSGQAARDYFERLIWRRLIPKLGRDAARRASNNLTFLQFRTLNETLKLGFRDLLVCGSNLSLGRSVLFSWKHTPNFPIADAVRISMGIPIAYKPYVITEDIDGYPPCGTYVDGGLWNNLPFREIGALEAAAPSAPAPSSGAPEASSTAPPLAAARPVAETAAERRTLGLRLEIVPPEPVMNAQAVILKSLAIAGETQILPDLDQFIQILDTRGLSTFQFKPPDRARVTVTKRSRRAMYRYFGKEPPEKDRDDMDDRETEELRSKSVCAPPAPVSVGGWR
jgi:predicted acylesterase/phospholipase RssA